MTRVFDASAVLAALFEEPGADRVVELWADGENLLSTVNYSEVVAKLAERGLGKGEIATVMEGVPLTLVDFDQHTAFAAGLLRATTKSLGLSLGDRACLALGTSRQASVITAEKIWKKVKGVDLVVIR